MQMSIIIINKSIKEIYFQTNSPSKSTPSLTIYCSLIAQSPPSSYLNSICSLHHMTSLHSVTPLGPNLVMRLNYVLFILTCLLISQCHSYNCASPPDHLCQVCDNAPACTLCNDGYYVDSIDGSCKTCGSKHPPACSACTETGCTRCPDFGFFPRNPCNSTIYTRPFSVRSMFFKLLQCVHFTRELCLLPTLNHSKPRRKWQRVHSGLFWYSELRHLRPRRQQQMPDMQPFICH